MTLKTAAEVRAEFLRTGATISQWAKEHGLSRNTVYDVLAGRKSGRNGNAHRAAVLLGLKEGVVPPVDHDRAGGKENV